MEKKETVIKTLFGEMLQSNSEPPEYEGERLVSFFSRENQLWDITEKQLSKHFMLIGGIGTGKTNTFYHFIENLDAKMSSSDIMIIFDTKGDFYRRFYRENIDYIIGNSSEFDDISSYWNIFREIEYGGRNRAEKELTAKEIAKTFFEERRNTSQPFFSTAACDIFSKILIHKMREFWNNSQYKGLEEELQKYPKNSGQVEYCIKKQHELFEEQAVLYNNKVLVEEMLWKYTAEDYCKILKSEDDFKSATSYIGDGKSNQALGVLGELNSVLNDYFIGIFSQYRAKKDISMRELVHKKGGCKIFVEYDLSVGETLCSVYRMLVDLALKEALGRQHAEGNVYLIIDEFKLLPKLTHIDDALNFGRTLGIKTIVGIQNIKQLEDVYGKTRGEVIAAGFSNVIAFRMMDEASRKYVSELFGKNYIAVQYWNQKGELKEVEREGYTVEDWHLMNLQIGQAIVGTDDRKPFYFHFREYEEDVDSG